MSNDEEDDSFLLVGIEDEDQLKPSASIINRETTSTIVEQKESIIEPEKNIEKKEPIVHKDKNKLSLKEKILNKLLSLDKPIKKGINKKFSKEDFFSFGEYHEKKYEYQRSNSNSFGNENSGNIDTSILYHKKKSVIRNILELKKENEWNEFIKEYKKEQKKKNKIKTLFKNTFNINSDFIAIWKFVYSLFYMIIFFFTFLHYIFYTLIYLKDDEVPKKNFLYLYYICHFMFLVDLILTILIIIANGGSLFTYLKIPIKIYLVILFPLKKKYIIFLIPKFCRIDLFRSIFEKNETFITGHITPYIQNYHLKIFILYMNRLFGYLLEFGLYAHFSCCLYSYLDNVNYIDGIYYTIETITTMGYGEHSPKNLYSMILVMFTIFLGSNLVILTNCNINFLTSKVRSFSRMTSPKTHLEIFIIHLESSMGKVVPNKLKDSLKSYIKFYRGLSFDFIKSNYYPLFSLLKPKMKKKLLNSSLNFLRLEFELYFHDCEVDFINSLFAKIKPKIYKEKKIIINIGQKVDKLYFLLNGILFGFDKYENNIFTINNNSLFCEYEFITGINSQLTIKGHPNITSYGFIINKKDWDIISKKYVYSAKKFIELCLMRRKKFREKLNEMYTNNIFNNKDIIDELDENKNIFDEINGYRTNVIKLEKDFVRFKKQLFKRINNID